VSDPFDALKTKLQAVVDKQVTLRWTPPAMLKSLQLAVDNVASLGVTIKLANPSGNGAPPSSGRKTDALSLGVGVSASAAASISAGLSLGIGISATASLLTQLTTGLHATISKVGTLERDLATYNLEAQAQAGTNGVMPPGRKVEQGPVNKSLRGVHDQISDCQSKASAAADGKLISPISAQLQHPRVGAWECSLDIDTETTPAGKIKFELDDIEFTGTVLPDHAGTDGARSKCRVVGGNGHLSNTVPAKSYSGGTGVKVGTIVGDILKACGEDLSDLSDGPTLERTLPRYHYSAMSAKQALTAIADQVDAAWRVLRDGTVWFGAETWPEVEPEGTVTNETWSNGHLTMASETPDMVPGTVFQGQKIEHVTHDYGTKLRTHLRTTNGSAVTALAKLAKQGQAIDYSREYPCEVVTQNPDGSLQLVADDEIMKSAGLDHVPIRYGMPGMKAQIAKGARCHLAFAAGDQKRPFVCSWEYDPSKVQLLTVLDGSQGRSGVGDLVQSGGPGTVCVLFPLPLGVGAPPNNAIVAGVPCLISFSETPLTPATLQMAVPLYGTVATGMEKFQG
jgi:hypothetical protein